MCVKSHDWGAGEAVGLRSVVMGTSVPVLFVGFTAIPCSYGGAFTMTSVRSEPWLCEMLRAWQGQLLCVANLADRGMCC